MREREGGSPERRGGTADEEEARVGSNRGLLSEKYAVLSRLANREKRDGILARISHSSTCAHVCARVHGRARASE